MPAPVTQQKRDEMFMAYAACTSLAHVQRSCKVDFRTAQKYRDLDEWDRRRHQLDVKLKEAAEGTVEESRRKYLGIIRAMVTDFYDRVVRSKVRIENTKDLVQVIAADQLLRGEATSRVETGPKVGDKVIAEMSDTEIQEALKDVRVEGNSLTKRIASAKRRPRATKKADPSNN